VLSPGRRGRWLLQRRLPEQPLLHSGWLRVVASAALAASTTVATADSSTAAMPVADALVASAPLATADATSAAATIAVAVAASVARSIATSATGAAQPAAVAPPSAAPRRH